MPRYVKKNWQKIFLAFSVFALTFACGLWIAFPVRSDIVGGGSGVIGGGSSGGVAGYTGTGAQLNAVARTIFDVTVYGAVGDGATDCTAAFNAAIAAAEAVGGAVHVPYSASGFVIAGDLVIPNNGASYPIQKPIRIYGDNPDYYCGMNASPSKGSIIILRYADAVAKIDTRGYGYLEIDHLSLVDDSDGTGNFIQSTNTTCNIHDVAFWGKTATTPVQDAIVFGGSHAVTLEAPYILGTGGADTGFQGYGSVVRNCFFNRIRRAFYARTTANSVIFRDNTIWTSCGGTAAIEVAGPGSGTFADTIGGVIQNNLIECNSYVYGIKLSNAKQWFISGNSCWDPGVNYLAGVRFEISARGCTLIGGFDGDDSTVSSKSFFSDATDAFGTQYNTLNVKWNYSGLFRPEQIIGSGIVTASPGLTPATGTDHKELFRITSSTAANLYCGTSAADPFGGWIQMALHNNCATTYPLLLNPRGGNIGVNSGAVTPGDALDIQVNPGNNNYAGLRISDGGYNTSSHSALTFFNDHASANYAPARIASEIGAAGTAAKLLIQVADSSKALQTRMTIDSAGAAILGGTLSVGSLLPTSTQTTLTGSAGTAVCSMPMAGSSYKRVIVYLSGYTGDGAGADSVYTFPTAFTIAAPKVDPTGLAGTFTANATTLTMTCTTQTGWVIIEGY
jgi:hypothetical protein